MLAEYIRAKSPEVKPGLSAAEIAGFETQLRLPLPTGVRELLGEVGGYEMTCEVQWQMEGDHYVYFGAGSGRREECFQPELFPTYVVLSHNGCGDSWVVDVDPSTGDWGHVVLCSHDAPSFHFQFANLEEFVKATLHEDFSLEAHTERSYQDCPRRGVPAPEARNVPELAEFANTLEDHYHVFDLRGRPLPCGFWRSDGDPHSKNVRWNHELLFASERRPLRGFLGTLKRLWS